MNLWKRFWCMVGIHDGKRTQHFGERKCECGGSYWGHVTEDRYTRFLGHFIWYSAKKIKEIEAAGKMQNLINGTGEFSQDNCKYCK